MAKAFPNSQFVCVDLDDHSIEHAKENAARAGVLGKNLTAEVRSVYDLHERDAYDLIFTFGGLFRPRFEPRLSVVV